jgi:hypothetical protein
MIVARHCVFFFFGKSPSGRFILEFLFLVLDSERILGGGIFVRVVSARWLLLVFCKLTADVEKRHRVCYVLS